MSPTARSCGCWERDPVLVGYGCPTGSPDQLPDGSRAEMATYTVSAGHAGVAPWSLTAAQVDTVTFTDNVGRIVIPNEGTVGVFATIDGSTPTVPAAGASTAALYIPPGMALTVNLNGAADTVKLVSSGTPQVSVAHDDL